MEANNGDKPVFRVTAAVRSFSGETITAECYIAEGTIVISLASPITIPLRQIETVSLASIPAPITAEAAEDPTPITRVSLTYLGESSTRLLTVIDLSVADAESFVKVLLAENIQVNEQVTLETPVALSGFRGTAFLPATSGPFETAEWSAENGFFIINSTNPVGIPFDKIGEAKVITTIVRTGKKPDNIPLTLKTIELSYANDSGEQLVKTFMLQSSEAEALASLFDASKINTSREERVELRFDYAGFWRRFAAVLIDGLILNTIGSAILIVLIVIATLIGISSEEKYGTLFLSNTMFIANVASLVYYLLFWSKGGQTPGKMALGLKIVTAEGKGISIGRAILRYFGYLVSTLMLGIGYLWITWDNKKQAIHDKIAGSYVIKV